MKIQIKRLPSVPGQAPLPLPEYKTSGAAGFDLCSASDVVILPGKRANIKTELSVAVPENFELQVRPRSGLAANWGISVVNSPGTVDSDYRGELIILLINLGEEEFQIERGDRIAQAVICPVVRVSFEEVEELPPTIRGEGGFGSTGV